jgi:hypothetical protein
VICELNLFKGILNDEASLEISDACSSGGLRDSGLRPLPRIAAPLADFAARDALRGSDLIIHAGDVGKPGIIERLCEIAPVVAVRDNIDKGDWASDLPAAAVAEAGSTSIYVLHDIAQLDFNPTAARFPRGRQRTLA